MEYPEIMLIQIQHDYIICKAHKKSYFGQLLGS